MSAWLAAAFAGLTVACLLAAPRTAGVRLEGLGAADTGTRPRGDVPTGLVVAAGAAAALALLGPVVALLATGAALVLLRRRSARRAEAARQEERARAVEACGALSAELRAGRTPADALAAAAQVASGPSRRALTAAASSARLGGDVAASLRTAPGTAVLRVLESLAACWTVCAGSGSGLAAAVERLEEALRADAAQRRAVEAELAGPRATALLLAGLPAAGLVMATGLGADPLHVLLATPVGLVSLALGLALDAAGLWWTGRLVARAGAAP